MLDITLSLTHQLILEQFPEYAELAIFAVEKQGHDNRSYRLGNMMLIRLPTAEVYALKVVKEQELLPKLAPYLSISIPVPVKMGSSSKHYPYPFSIYKWLAGRSVNLLCLDEKTLEQLAYDLAKFLLELQRITGVEELLPGQHNWWRGDHVSVYQNGAQTQIEKLIGVIDADKAMKLWQDACQTKWDRDPVWIHGDIALGNILILNNNLSAIIDFGGMAIGDPACDLVIAWTLFKGRSRDIFIREMKLDANTWLRAKAWALWKASFELCQIKDKNSIKAMIQRKIIEDILDEGC